MELTYMLLFLLLINSKSNRLKRLKFNTESKNYIEAYCFLNNDGVVYDILKLYDTEDYTFENKNNTFYLNFCNFSNTKCHKDNTFITSIKDNNEKCHLLSGTNPTIPSKWTIIDENNFKIELPEGDICKSDANKYYVTIYKLKCDIKVEKLSIDNTDEINTDNCSNTIKMRSKYACPNYELFGLANLIKKNSLTFGLLMIFAGSYFCLFAYRYKETTRVLTGLSFVLFITFYVLMYHISFNINSIYFWLIIMGSVFVGAFLGCIILNYPIISPIILGGLFGYVFGQVFYQAIVIAISTNPETLYMISLLSSTGFGIYLGIRYPKYVLIISSAFLGSYSIVRGIGAIYNNFPDEKQLLMLIQRNELYQLNKFINFNFYLFIFGNFILGSIGICMQFKYFFKDMKDNGYNKLD